MAPLLLLILFAIFDVGSALNDLNDETNLANVAARYASVAPADAPTCTCSNTNWCSGGVAVDLYGYVACEAQTDSGSLASGIGVCVSDLGPGTSYAAGDAVKVTVYYPYNFLSFISGVVRQEVDHAQQQRDDDDGVVRQLGFLAVGHRHRYEQSRLHQIRLRRMHLNRLPSIVRARRRRSVRAGRRRRTRPGDHHRGDRDGGCDRDRGLRDQHGRVVGPQPSSSGAG